MIRDTTPSSHTKVETRGCVDVGSTNFRLLVVDGVFPGEEGAGRGGFELRAERRTKRFVAWGEDLAREGRISAVKAAAASRALGELLAEARAWGCPRPAIVATNTLREAANAGEVARALEAAHGVSIRVLSQREEAALGYRGASFFRPAHEPICLVDAGGTSTEICWGRGRAFAGYRGLPLGTHRVERILERGGGERRAVRAVSGMLSAALLETPSREGVYPLPARGGDPTMVFTGGTAVSLAIYHRYLGGLAPSFEEMQPLTRDDVTLARRRVAGIRGAGRARRLPLDPGRIGLFPAGLALIEALLGGAGAEVFRVTARDLRWGVVLARGASA